MENACESAQTERELSIQEAPRSRCFAQDASRARGSIRGWIQKTITIKKSPKKPINRVCPCEESTDERIEGQGRLIVQGILPGEEFPCQVHLVSLASWGPVTEARPLPVHGSTPGTSHCLQYQSSWPEVVFNKRVSSVVVV